MTDELDDFLDDDNEDPEAAAAAAAAKAAEEKAAADAKAKADAEAAAAAEAKRTQELALGSLNALKQSWSAEAAAAGHAAADFDGIGLAGFDDAAKAKFMEEAKASHDARVEQLAALGFHYDPQAAGGQRQEEQDAAAAAAWGGLGPGQVAGDDKEYMETVANEVKSGDTMGVIGSMLSKGGLADFWKKQPAK